MRSTTHETLGPLAACRIQTSLGSLLPGTPYILPSAQLMTVINASETDPLGMYMMGGTLPQLPTSKFLGTPRDASSQAVSNQEKPISAGWSIRRRYPASHVHYYTTGYSAAHTRGKERVIMSRVDRCHTSFTYTIVVTIEYDFTYTYMLLPISKSTRFHIHNSIVTIEYDFDDISTCRYQYQ